MGLVNCLQNDTVRCLYARLPTAACKPFKQVCAEPGFLSARAAVSWLQTSDAWMAIPLLHTLGADSHFQASIMINKLENHDSKQCIFVTDWLNHST